MTSQRPYLKFLIAGGVVCAEGGSLLPAGLEFFFLMGGLESNILRALAITFTIIGSVSLCIGLSLLYKGVKQRNVWLAMYRGHSTTSDREEPLERPIKRAPLPENAGKRFCAICGNPLPNLPNIKFCPKCGEDIF